MRNAHYAPLRLLLAVVLLAGLAGSARAANIGDEPRDHVVDGIDVKDTIKRSFKVRPGGTLFLDIDHGNVEIETGDGEQVLVEIERVVRGKDRDDAKRILEDHELQFDQEGDDVTIRSRFDHNDRWRPFRGKTEVRMRFYVRVPASYDIDFSTGAGNVAVSDIRGEVVGRTGAGNVMIGEVEGRVDVRSGAGNIQVRGAQGSIEVHTGAGNIDIGDVYGDVDVQSGAGNITARIVRQPDRDSNLETGAGNVTVYLADGIGVDVDAQANMGSARTDFPLRIEGKWMHKSIEGKVNGGGPLLAMQAGVGNVALLKQ